MLDDQVVGCEEAVVVGGTAAAVAVAAAADVPVSTTAAVAKGLTNTAAVFDLRVPTAVAAAFHHYPQNHQNYYVGRRSPPSGLAESHRQRARGDRARPSASCSRAYRCV